MPEYSNDTIDDVAEANRIRRDQIREWAKQQIDQDAAVTFLDDGAYEEQIAVQQPDAQVEPAPEADHEPALAVPKAERPEDTTVSYEDAHREDSSVDEQEGEEEAADQASSEADEPQAEEEVEEPNKSANKGEWVAYRMATHGLTEDEANEYTKEELIALG